MERKTAVSLVAFGLLSIILAVGTSACAGTQDLSTTAPGGVTATGPTSAHTTQGGATTGGAATSTAASVADSAYVSAMQAWMNTYLFSMDTSALTIDDPANATSGQLAAAERFAQDVHTGVTKLQAVKPPAVISDIHSEFVTAMVQLAAAIDKYVAAVKTGKQSEVDAIMPTFAAAQSRVQAATNVLAPDVGIQIPDTAGIE